MNISKVIIIILHSDFQQNIYKYKHRSKVSWPLVFLEYERALMFC